MLYLYIFGCFIYTSIVVTYREPDVSILSCVLVTKSIDAPEKEFLCCMCSRFSIICCTYTLNLNVPLFKWFSDFVVTSDKV